ncbi:MAG: RusA family crossover junction endodeoxyribonuclease [Crocinitomicaceae bacterium]|nr:RusA family crossover junction endodeoxyribonuclease [Crocinitomicaceae bacterium]MCF8432936.1 RusA family crossover junction endodeoxyribonuclease [Crocinitomicaceae bacterium]
MTHSFVFRGQPKSYNSWKKNNLKGQAYIQLIRNSLEKFCHPVEMQTGDLYGIAYYFFNKPTGTDADNISKPIWDSLTEFLFVDDKQVKYRIAGSFDLSQNDFDLIDVTGIPGEVVVELVEAVQNEDHVVYVECGEMNNAFFKFNLEQNGN